MKRLGQFARLLRAILTVRNKYKYCSSSQRLKHLLASRYNLKRSVTVLIPQYVEWAIVLRQMIREGIIAHIAAGSATIHIAHAKRALKPIPRAPAESATDDLNKRFYSALAKSRD
ncbi:hypothetical protein ASD45_14425 [Pseudolabrys sp. Root1462]|nr:hypothetical protein ASD45_14425 [Pseudolabrys sp. Root1462]